MNGEEGCASAEMGPSRRDCAERAVPLWRQEYLHQWDKSLGRWWNDREVI